MKLYSLARLYRIENTPRYSKIVCLINFFIETISENKCEIHASRENKNETQCLKHPCELLNFSRTQNKTRTEQTENEKQHGEKKKCIRKCILT